MRVKAVVVLAGLALVAGCIPKPAVPPPPGPQPQPAPPPPPVARDWRYGPLNPGGWTYSDRVGHSEAGFGVPGAARGFVVRCDRATRTVLLARDGGAVGGAMTIRTSSDTRSLPIAAVPGNPAPGAGAASLPANDRFLDAMVFSRGRFVVEMAGAPMLVMPSWPEPARVVEDCRS